MAERRSASTISRARPSVMKAPVPARMISWASASSVARNPVTLATPPISAISVVACCRISRAS